VAMDGPAGSGKSSVARAVAARLGFVNLGTGAAYRAVALLALRDGIPADDGESETRRPARASASPSSAGMPSRSASRATAL